ncbi:MAG: TolC family protein [Bryobacteraceae bacterium]|jgi:outer membrane protein TolC
MAIRSVSVLALFIPAALPLAGQEPAGFPPSQPYRAQLEQRGPVREIGLHDAIRTALAHNLEIEIENDGGELSQAGTLGALSYYDPVAGFSGSAMSSDLPVTNILQTGALGSLITKSWSLAPNIQQNLPGGGTASLTTSLTRSSTNSDYAIINPMYGATVGLTLTQPLWRGFRRTAAQRQIVVAQLNERLTESQFRQKVASVVEQVIGAYWRLAVTVEYYEAQRQARDVAVFQYEQTQARLQQGQETPLTLSTQRSDLASHEQTLTEAAVQIVQSSNALKRLLARGVMDPLWNVGLIASDRPGSPAPIIGLEEAVKTALQRRPELEQLRLQLKQADADIRFDRQETKPAVNLRLEALSTGDAGAVYAASAVQAVSPVLDPSNPAFGGVGKSYSQAARFQHPSLAAGLDIKIPLRNRAAISQLTTAVVGARKLQSQFEATQADILVEVRNAWESIAAQEKNVEAVSLSRRLAEERLAADTAKNGSAPQSLEILGDRRDLADAGVRELQALIDYRLSHVSLDKAMNTLVDEQEIVLARRK